MNWLTKILKKEKKAKEERPVEEKTAPSKLSLAPAEELKKAKTEYLRGKKKFDQSAILANHLTEKSSAGRENNKYIFKVSSGADKTTVKNAIEDRFGVQVRSINILNMPGKERKKGGQIGFRSGFKKAMVTLAEGQSIEIT